MLTVSVKIEVHTHTHTHYKTNQGLSLDASGKNSSTRWTNVPTVEASETHTSNTSNTLLSKSTSINRALGMKPYSVGTVHTHYL